MLLPYYASLSLSLSLSLRSVSSPTHFPLLDGKMAPDISEPTDDFSKCGVDPPTEGPSSTSEPTLDPDNNAAAVLAPLMALVAAVLSLLWL